MALSVSTGTIWLDPSYEFIISLLQTLTEEGVSHIPWKRSPPEAGREHIAEIFMAHGQEWLLFLDDDMVFPLGFVERLVSHDKPVVGGLFFMRAGDLAPVLCGYLGLLLDWREHRGLPVMRCRLENGTYQFGFNDGRNWHTVGEKFQDKPQWIILPGGTLDRACQQTERNEQGLKKQFEELERLGTYTAHLYNPLWSEVGNWLASHTWPSIPVGGPILLPEKDGSLVKVDAVGGGCLLIHREVLAKVPRPWFSAREGGTEDFYFCRKAKQAGFEIYGDMSVICDHDGVNHMAFIERYRERLFREVA